MVGGPLTQERLCWGQLDQAVGSRAHSELERSLGAAQATPTLALRPWSLGPLTPSQGHHFPDEGH